MVRQTIEDCLHEVMDVDGFLEVLRGLRDGTIRKVAVDTREPSAFARGILNVMPYGFLDDAPLEERRTQAVLARHRLDPETADTLGALDPDAVARVREQAWPQPENVEEVHEALLWMGYVTHEEAEQSEWVPWLEELRAAGRIVDTGNRWRAVEASEDPKAVLRGRLEALGPVVVGTDVPESEQHHLLELEVEGVILRCRLEGRQAWCDRRLLARIHRDTLERLRREIEPVTAAELWRFLASWQRAVTGFRVTGPSGVIEVARQLAGFEIAAAAWESSVLPARVEGFRQEWLDQATLSGELVWGRLWGGGNTPIRSTPVCLLPREDLDLWRALAASPTGPREAEPLGSYATILLDLLNQRGATFTQELQRASGLLSSHVEMGLVQLIGHGIVTCDSWSGLRRLITPPSRRRGVMKRVPYAPAGRWTTFRGEAEEPIGPRHVEFVARRLLDRYGIVFRRVVERERIPVPWRDLVRVYRLWELRGEVRGGRFVQRFAGEQYAKPEAVELMRRLRRNGRGAGDKLSLSASDPLNLEGILTPEPRVPAQARRRILVA